MGGAARAAAAGVAGGRASRAKESGKPLEAGGGEQAVPPARACTERHSLADTPTSTQGESFPTSDLQKHKRINLCCFSPLLFLC